MWTVGFWQEKSSTYQGSARQMTETNWHRPLEAFIGQSRKCIYTAAIDRFKILMMLK